MANINLKNPNLRKIIREHLNLKQFDEPFQTLIEEAFLRENYVLDLTPEELLEDMNNFKNSVYQISWGNCGGSKNTMGCMYPSQHKIEFNFEFWNNIRNMYSPNIYCLKFFETFSHEFLHGTQMIFDDKGKIKNRAGGWNTQLKSRSHALYEICTQGTAAKMANDRFSYQYNTNEILSGDGYSDEIFAVPLIASTFGVSEQEVLKYGMREREKLIQVLNKNIGNIEKTTELLSKIENQLEYLHSIHYPDDNQEKFINMSEDEKKKKSTQIIIKLVDICQEALAYRILNTPLDFNENIAINYKYDQRKIEDTLREEIELYCYNFNKDYISFYESFNFTPNARYIKNAIEVFNQIGKDKTGRFLKIAPELIDAVKRNDFEFCFRAGIIKRDDVTFGLVEGAYDFNLKRVHEDYNDFKKWDNKAIFDAIYPGLNIPFVNFETSNFKSWNSLYTNQGLQKIQDLRCALIAQKGKYGIESKEYLLTFFETQSDQMEQFYSKFTRKDEARTFFKRSFRTIDDKEFLARFIAEMYINKNFEENGALKQVSTDEERQMQELFQPTLLKYGRSQLIFALGKIIVNDEVNGISSSNSRYQLAMIGRKRIFDVVSQPMIDGLLNQRKIIPKKQTALRRAVYQTNKKYPNSIPARIVRLIDEYKLTGNIQSKLFTSLGREEFIKNFTGNSKRDMEDLLGILLNTYADFSNMIPQNDLTDIINKNGKDYFRENLIKCILYNDFSGFTNMAEIQSIKNMSIEDIITQTTLPFVERSMITGKVEERMSTSDYYRVQPTEIGSIASKAKFRLFSRITDGLIRNKERIYGENSGELLYNE